MKNKIVLVEMLKIVTQNFTVYERELLIQLIKRKSQIKMITVKVGKQKRRIIKTHEVTNSKILKSLINEIKQKNLKACRVSKYLFQSMMNQFEQMFESINKLINKKEVKTLIQKLITSSRQRSELIRQIETLNVQGGI